MRRHIAVLVAAVFLTTVTVATTTSTAVVAGTTAGANEYVAGCDGISRSTPCAHLVVYPKSLSDRIDDLGGYMLQCRSRSSARCVHWVVTSNGDITNDFAGHPAGISLVGDCVVEYAVISSAETHGSVAGGDYAFLDQDCDGIETDADHARPGNQFTQVLLPNTSPLGVPKVLLANVTMVDGRRPGYVTVDSCTSISRGPQTRSTGNFGVGEAIANLAVVATSFENICVYNSADVNLIVDQQGYFEYSGGGGGANFNSVTPRRLLDTRTPPSTQPAAGSVTRVTTDAPSGTTAVMVNLTMTDGALPGYITADRCSALVAGPQTHSSGNYRQSTAIANLAVVPVDEDGSFCIFNSTAVDLVVDVQGRFVPAYQGGQGFEQVPAARVLDTRQQPTTPTSGSITTVHTAAPDGTTAVLVNLTMVDAIGPGYITADLCTNLRAEAQSKSSGNFVDATGIANLAVVPVAVDGTFCVYNSQQADVVVDVQGAFSAAGLMRYFPIDALRLFDTRIAPRTFD